MRRRLVPVFVILVILAIAWSGGWFWLARWAGQTATTTFEELAENGVTVDCQNRAVVGFPFALRIACAETAVAERSTETKASLAGLLGGATMFAPLTVRIAMTSPARVDSALLGAAEMQWDAAAISVGMGTNGPRDVTFDTADLTGEFSSPVLPVQKVAARSAEGLLAPSANGGTDVAVSFSDLGVSLGGHDFPLVTGSAAGELSVPPRALLAGRAAMQAPITMRAIDIALESGGAKLKAEGEIAVDAEGVLDGAITLRVAGAAALPALIAALPPAWQKLGNVVAGGLFAFGKATTLDGEPASELTVEINQGDAKIGPIEFGLPRVPL